ncbi:MAG: phage minor head protein [Chloroflexota bacterium]
MATTLVEALDRFLEVAGAVRHNRRKRRALAPLERDLTRALAKAFRRQGKAFVKRFAALKDRFPTETMLESAIGNWEWEGLFDEAALATLKAFAQPLSRAARKALLKGALQAIADAETAVAFDLKNPRAVAWLQDFGGTRVKRVNDHTKEVIGRIVTQAGEEGWSYNRTAQAITQRFEEFAAGKPQAHIDSRAHLVAVTEVGDAYEEGNFQAAQALQDIGLEMEKKWSDSGDGKVSDGCQANSAAGWIPLNQPFPSGHQRPLRFPGCRCDLLTRRKGAEE